ncbi:hypothetical protein FEM48_Zijuj04G0120000 [Ziziphus jujuba var. spinosa]|uniref:Uncharacterized protein n=1 Tax=Ziziphus jujuba var. spinosa TaxID=714518 RepID=A0A978VJR6_ZIZJJ|nr:uncharacterized protein LOC107417329 [Ziziphus jujuba var. spinosa]KAH7533335.1 hypothetical protein FEM48_Zijuj04G0120000 [Ziziphus jujuba var. spinosa]
METYDTYIVGYMKEYLALKKNVIDSNEQELEFENKEMAINYLVENIALMKNETRKVTLPEESNARLKDQSANNKEKKRELVLRIRDMYLTTYTVNEDGSYMVGWVSSVGLPSSRNIRTSTREIELENPTIIRTSTREIELENPTNIRTSPGEIKFKRSTNIRTIPRETKTLPARNKRRFVR